MLSPVALSAIAAAVGAAISVLALWPIFRRRERKRAEHIRTKALEGIERRQTNVNVEISEHIRQVINDTVEHAVGQYLRGLCGGVDRRMASFENTQRSTHSVVVGAMEEWRKNQESLIASERQRTEETIGMRRAAQTMTEVGQQLLELLGPVPEPTK